MGNKQQKTLFSGLFVACVFCFGLAFDQLGFRFVSLVMVSLTTIGILYLPTKISVIIALTFISFQGFFKVISNYHPVVHLGADIVVIFLVVKFIYLQASNKIQSNVPMPPLTNLFMIHFAWIFIIYFNPYSLSLIASVAGSKVYVSMIMLYFFGYFLTNSKKDVHQFFALFVILSLIHTVFAIHQGIMGPSSVTAIHPRYSVQLAKYMATAFRPFGLTHIPGGPSVYIYTSLPFIAYFIYYGRHWLIQLLLSLSIPFTGLALMFCQVRSAIVKAIFSLAFFVVSLYTSHLKMPYLTRLKYLTGTAVLAIAVGFALPQFMKVSTDSYSDNERAFERSLSSFDIDAMSKARRNTWSRFVLYLQTVPMGAGFSRVGASAGAFYRLNKTDHFFPEKFFFGDNLFITILIELGIPGLIIMSSLIGMILYRGVIAWRKETRQGLITPQLAILSALFAIAIGSYGAEGIIYNPESCFFWFFAGVLMRMQNQGFSEV